jgi:hypothetical protein
MCDKLVFDLAQEVDGSPNVFIRKDWINILDNQNQNYQNNQSIIDTSQLSNSNKYMSYREAYLMIPMVLTFSNNSINIVSNFGTDGSVNGNLNKVVGLKNWFGQIIHSFTLDYNGTTIIQQTPFINMWNTFKLMTTLSWDDVITQGPTIGFYPDDPTSFVFNSLGATALATSIPSGQGTCNNAFSPSKEIESNNPIGATSMYDRQNEGYLFRLNNIVYNPDSQVSEDSATITKYSNLQSSSSTTALWRSYISKKFTSSGADGLKGYMQITINAIVYLKHIHSFFNSVPILKGAFMKMTMNLNNASAVIVVDASVTSVNAALSLATGGTVTPSVPGSVGNLKLTSAIVPIGGTLPFLVSSMTSINKHIGQLISNVAGAVPATPPFFFTANDRVFNNLVADSYTIDLSVGNTPLSSALRSVNSTASSNKASGSGSIYLYIPAYSFNPAFEKAYISNPVKTIKYTDLYQYQVINVGKAPGAFNNLITNGISNIRSVLIIPYYSSSIEGPVAGLSWAGLPTGIPSYQSPFDTAGTGTTAPYAHFSNFNIQVSGQNAIYNMQRYNFEEWNNQLYGQNSVNGGMTDGLNSGLIDYLGFQTSQCFYYVNVERMLPVEQSVPKSIQILGNNLCERNLDLFVFVEFGTEISIDILTGARI